MDIDKHDIQILATEVCKILIESSSTLLKTYPKASFALGSFFISYIFFSAIFWFLINTIPLVVLIGAISIKTYIIVNEGRGAQKHEKLKDGKSPRGVESAQDASNDNKKYNAKHARSVRRVRSKVIFAESRQDSIQEKEAISSTNFSYDLVDKRPLTEETPKEIREVEVNTVSDRAESYPSYVFQDFRSQFNSMLRSQSFGGSALDVDGISSENAKDEDDDSRGEDQKPLADVGLSEIERIRRLEILMARRRERKTLSLQARREMMNMGDNDSPCQMMYSIAVPKMSHLSPRTAQTSPGSAPPAALLPTRNPFDLPYELHEEKPILTEDSFHQEFLGTHPKDMMFYRHKSFCSGGILPEDMRHNLHQTSLHNNYGTKQEKPKRQSGDEDDEKEVEQERSQEAKSDDKVENTDKNIPDQGSEQGLSLDDLSREDIENEVKTKSVIVEDYNAMDSFSSSSEESEPIHVLDREKLLKSLSSLHPRNMNIQRGDSRIDDNLFNHGSSGTDKAKGTGPFNYFYSNIRHASSLSIASDMQVEVSELGSPRLLSDGNNSSTDEVGSLCDSKFEKEVPASEDLSITSSQQPKVEESKSRDLGQVSEKDTIGVGFSRIKESKIPAERIITQDSSDPHRNSVSESKVPGDDEYKDYTERIVHEHPLEAKDDTEKKILVGANVIQNEDISEKIDDESPFPHKTVNNRIPNELQNSASGSESEEYLKATIVNGSTGESSQPTFAREVEGIPQEMLQHSEIQDSRSTEGNYILESTTDTEDEASSIALAASEPSQFVIHPNEVAPAPELLTAEVPTALSRSSSPKSVLNPMISADQGSVSHSSDIVQMENPRSGSNSISPSA